MAGSGRYEDLGGQDGLVGGDPSPLGARSGMTSPTPIMHPCSRSLLVGIVLLIQEVLLYPV